jgi:hypothetical protein
VCGVSWFKCDDGLTYSMFCEVGTSPQCSCYIDGGLAVETDASGCGVFEEDAHPSLLTLINDTCGWCIGITCPKR